MNTVYGILADALGHATRTSVEQGPTRPELRSHFWATPAGEVRSVQAARIPVDQGHDHQAVGQVVYLERCHGNLWAVAHVNDDIIPAVEVRVAGETVAVPHLLFWSAERRSAPDFTDIVLDWVSLTALPARVWAQPLTFLPGDLKHRTAAPDAWRTRVTPNDHELLSRAARAIREREPGEPLVVVDFEPPTGIEAWQSVGRDAGRAADGTRPLHHGAVVRGSVLSVR